MFMAYSECEHPECDIVTFVALDAFLSGPGDMTLTRSSGADICIRKRQSNVGKFTRGVKAGCVGVFADLLTRCSKHSTGNLPEAWIKEDVAENKKSVECSE